MHGYLHQMRFRTPCHVVYKTEVAASLPPQTHESSRLNITSKLDLIPHMHSKEQISPRFQKSNKRKAKASAIHWGFGLRLGMMTPHKDEEQALKLHPELPAKKQPRTPWETLFWGKKKNTAIQSLLLSPKNGPTYCWVPQTLSLKKITHEKWEF